MTTSTLPQEATIVQYLGDNTTTVFTFPFFIFTSKDITVYVTPSGQAANPTSDIKILGTDYSVTINATTFPGQAMNGFITFTVAPGANYVVTLVSSVVAEYEFDFTQAQTINGGNLNSAYERLTVVCQELLTFYNTRALQYVVNNFLPASNPPTSGTSNQLPSLFVNSQGQPTSNQVWVSQGGAIVAAQLTNLPASTLAAQLAVTHPSNGDGTNLIGYFNQLTNAGGTLNNFLNNLVSKGTFTPTFIPSSGAFGAITYTTQLGEYTQIGNVVYFTINLQLSAFTVGTATGHQLFIGNLPIAAGGAAISISSAVLMQNITYTGIPSVQINAVSGTILDIAQTVTSTGVTLLTCDALSATSTLRFSGFYFTS